MSRGLALLAVGAIVITACGSSPASQAEQVTAMCESIRAFHNDMGETANDMAEREIDATAQQRAEILAGALEDMIDTARTVSLPADPAELAAGLEDRRSTVVAEMEANLVHFRTAWPEVESDDRPAAVPQVFLWLEKLTANTQPRITSDTPAALIEHARVEPACAFVVDGLE